MSTRGLIKEVRAGEQVVIFPEGRLTVTGALMKVYDGAAMIADKSDAMVVPVRLDGLERTPFTRLPQDARAPALFPEGARHLPAAAQARTARHSSAARRRIAAGAALYDVMSDLVFRTTDTDLTLIEALARSVSDAGGSRIIVEDPISGAALWPQAPDRRRRAGPQARWR